MAVGLPDPVRHLLLLSHTAADANDLPRVPPLAVDQGPDVPKDPVLGVAPDGAGVDEDDIGLVLVLGKAVAHAFEIAPQPLRVGLILLTAVGVHKGQIRPGLGGEPLLDLLAELPLPGDLLGRNAGGFGVHALHFLPMGITTHFNDLV